MFQRDREVDSPFISLLSAGSPSDHDSTLCDIDDLSMKTCYDTKLKFCIEIFTMSETFMEIAIHFVGKW